METSGLTRTNCSGRSRTLWQPLAQRTGGEAGPFGHDWQRLERARERESGSLAVGRSCRWGSQRAARYATLAESQRAVATTSERVAYLMASEQSWPASARLCVVRLAQARDNERLIVQFWPTQARRLELRVSPSLSLSLSLSHRHEYSPLADRFSSAPSPAGRARHAPAAGRAHPRGPCSMWRLEGGLNNNKGASGGGEPRRMGRSGGEREREKGSRETS